jgi:hypothetical protein
VRASLLKARSALSCCGIVSVLLSCWAKAIVATHASVTRRRSLSSGP